MIFAYRIETKNTQKQQENCKITSTQITVLHGHILYYCQKCQLKKIMKFLSVHVMLHGSWETELMTFMMTIKNLAKSKSMSMCCIWVLFPDYSLWSELVFVSLFIYSFFYSISHFNSLLLEIIIIFFWCTDCNFLNNVGFNPNKRRSPQFLSCHTMGLMWSYCIIGF